MTNFFSQLHSSAKPFIIICDLTRITPTIPKVARRIFDNRRGNN